MNAPEPRYQVNQLAPDPAVKFDRKIAEQYVAAFEKLAKTGNTLIVPADLSNVSTLIASAMQTVKSQNVSR